jgi:hypothetical protein
MEKKKILNEFEKECTEHGGILAKELLAEDLKFQTLAKGKILDMFVEENNMLPQNLKEL